MNKTNTKSPSMEWTGERYLPEIGGMIELEHLHRYLIATNLVKAKRVLDIACGEGYGSDKLALFANYVIGVDIAENAVNHARSKYRSPNLEFRVGSVTEIPVKSNSVDVVVSFETIEHHDQHKNMMLEIKRVLMPGGLLIISSPDKNYYSVVPNYSNPHHVKELFADELEQLLKIYFKNVQMWGQRVVYGSLVVSQKKMHSSFKCITKENEKAGLSRPVYDIAITSDNVLPELYGSLFEIPIDGVDAAAHLTNRIAWLDQAIAERDGQIKNFRQSLAENDKQINTYVNAIAERDKYINDILSSKSWRLTKPLRLLQSSFVIRLLHIVYSFLLSIARIIWRRIPLSSFYKDKIYRGMMKCLSIFGSFRNNWNSLS